jgi:hypothetical protein
LATSATLSTGAPRRAVPRRPARRQAIGSEASIDDVVGHRSSAQALARWPRCSTYGTSAPTSC